MVKTIRSLCKKNNISISQLEADLNFGTGLISRWIKSSPSIDKIVAIADYFHISIDDVIGRTIKPNYVTPIPFIDTLYDMTLNKTIVWEDRTQMIPDMENDEKFYIENDGFSEQEMFVAAHNNGFIWLYCQYDEEKGNITEIYIEIYIQPNNKSKIVLQKIDNDDKAIMLWEYIHTLLFGTLDEVKAEEFKNNLVNTPDNLNYEKINEFLLNPSFVKLLETVSTSEFKKMQQIFEDPGFKSALKFINETQKQLDEVLSKYNKKV